MPTSGERVRRHLALQAELHVVCGERIAIVELLPGADVEGPGQTVLGHLPALGHAGPDAALLEIEADE